MFSYSTAGPPIQLSLCPYVSPELKASCVTVAAHGPQAVLPIEKQSRLLMSGTACVTSHTDFVLLSHLLTCLKACDLSHTELLLLSVAIKGATAF